MVVSPAENAESPLPLASVSGQTNAQSFWRALSVKAREKGSSDKTETTTAAEKIILRGAEGRELVE